LFAMHTGMRLGDLNWGEVDIRQDAITFIVQKTRRILELPLNNEAARVIRAWNGIRRCGYVFYNLETGDQFKHLWLDLKESTP
jgi:integrase